MPCWPCGPGVPICKVIVAGACPVTVELIVPKDEVVIVIEDISVSYFVNDEDADSLSIENYATRAELDVPTPSARRPIGRRVGVN